MFDPHHRPTGHSETLECDHEKSPEQANSYTCPHCSWVNWCTFDAGHSGQCHCSQGHYWDGTTEQRGGRTLAKHRIYTTSFASVYPHYVAKAEKKGRTKAEVDEIIAWLTGYGPDALEAELAERTDFESFFAKAPRMNPAREAITGVVCGVRVETIEEPLMREIRYLDKLVDELARGKRMTAIFREG